jgi:acetolactate synthase regulatory subunit
MTHALSLMVRREEAVLVRVLGLMVRRGFEPLQVEANVSRDGTTFTIDVTVQGERSIDVLVRQLVKLHDVERVDVAV